MWFDILYSKKNLENFSILLNKTKFRCRSLRRIEKEIQFVIALSPGCTKLYSVYLVILVPLYQSQYCLRCKAVKSVNRSHRAFTGYCVPVTGSLLITEVLPTLVTLPLPVLWSDSWDQVKEFLCKQLSLVWCWAQDLS